MARAADARRLLAQQSPRVPDDRVEPAALVAARSLLLGHRSVRPPRSRHRREDSLRGRGARQACGCGTPNFLAQGSIMSHALFILSLLGFVIMFALPRVFFRSDGKMNARWWLTGAPFGIALHGVWL